MGSRKKKNNAKSKVKTEPEPGHEPEPKLAVKSYYVESVEKKRINLAKNCCEWNLKWIGYKNPSWQPAKDFVDTSFDKLKDFENKLKDVENKLRDLENPEDRKKLNLLDLRKNFSKLNATALESKKDDELKELKAVDFEIVQYSIAQNVFIIRLVSNGQLWAVNKKNIQDNFKDNNPVIDMFCEFARRSLVNTRIDLRNILKEPGRQLDGDKLWIDFPRVVDSTNPSPSNAVVLDDQIPGTSKQQPMDQS